MNNGDYSYGREEYSSIWPWLNQQQHIPHPDEFLSIPRGPIVHEGFVPDENVQDGGWRDEFLAPDLAYSPDRQDVSDEEMLDDDDEQMRPVDDVDSDPDFEERDEVEQDDEILSDEAFEDDDDGPFARSRGRRGKNKGPRIFTTSRGRYGRNMGRGGRGIKRGPRQPAEPSQEFMIIQNRATDAFIDERDYEKALNLINQAISINPEVYSAHSLLSEIYFARGDEEKAIAALLAGAHALPKEPSVWHQIAEVCLQRVSDKNRTRALQSASYCYARLLQIDQRDHDSRFQRAAISRQLGNRGKALKDLERLLVELPNNPSVLRQMAEVYTDMKLPQRARELYERCIAYHQSVDDRDSFTFSDINVYVELFAFTKEYARGVAVLKSLSRWLLGRKSEVYWDAIQMDDREWDAEDEPRRTEVHSFESGAYPPETYGYGLPLELRVKLGIFRFRMGEEHHPEAAKHFTWLEAEDGEETSKAEDYADLYRDAADTLSKAGLLKDALKFYEPLCRLNVYTDTAFHLAAANCFLECSKLDDAIIFFEKVKDQDASNVEARYKLSRVYNQKGLITKSKEIAQEAITIGRENLIRPQRRRYERREQREQRERAEREFQNVHKLKVSKLKSVPNTTNPDLPVWRDGTSKQPLSFENPEKAPSATERRRQKMQTERESAEDAQTAYIKSRYQELLEVQDAARAGDSNALETWLDTADGMITDFRSNRALFPSERHMLFEGFEPEARKRAVRKLHQKAADSQTQASLPDDGPVAQSVERSSPFTDIPTSYGGVPFSTWLDIFLEYSLLLARMGQEHKAQSYATLQAAMDCTVWYHSRQSMLLIHTVWFTAALALNDADAMYNIALRWFMREFQFVSNIYGLFSALNILREYPPADKATQMRSADFRAGPTQKFIFRQVKANDFYLPSDYNVGEKAADDAGPVPSFMREEGRVTDDVKASLSYKDPATGEVLAPQEMEIALLVLYGQILYAGNSFPNALNYFYRAYALNPRSPLVCLSIALCYIHQSLKRQSENRHMLVIQGMAFFQEYVECRLPVERQRQKELALREIEYNRARIWHMLGMSNLAVEDYWRVLREGTTCSVKREAALALQTIYAISGDTERARDITEKWLVIE